MARTDRIFSKLDLTYRSPLPEFYKKHLKETVDGFEGTRHVWWTHMRTTHGYPGHKMYGRLLPLSGYLVFKIDGFTLAGDEALVTVCGVSTCAQTAHFRLINKSLYKKGEITE